jgi:hypothetical protein
LKIGNCLLISLFRLVIRFHSTVNRSCLVTVIIHVIEAYTGRSPNILLMLTLAGTGTGNYVDMRSISLSEWTSLIFISILVLSQEIGRNISKDHSSAIPNGHVTTTFLKFQRSSMPTNTQFLVKFQNSKIHNVLDIQPIFLKLWIFTNFVMVFPFVVLVFD